MAEDKLPDERREAGGEVADFLRKVAATPARKPAGERGRLVFAMDATASRQPTWDRAANLQGEMFHATDGLGGLELQLVFFRGFGEFKASPWVTDTNALTRLMTSVQCFAGETQIAKVLQHAINQTKERRVDAVILVGDCMEEDVDRLGHLAGELGVLGVPVFVFQEGDDAVAGFAFRQVAKLSGGACVSFDAASAGILRDLLSAVAVFAADGRPALEDLARKKGGKVLALTNQMGRR